MKMKKTGKFEGMCRCFRTSLSAVAILSFGIVTVQAQEQAPGQNPLAPGQEQIGMGEAKARLPEPVSVPGWSDKSLVPYLMFAEPEDSDAEIGARNFFGNELMTVWVQDLDGDHVGEMLVFHGDRCEKLEYQGDKMNCVYSILAWDGKTWQSLVSHLARQTHLALGYKGEIGFAFDGLAFGYKKGKLFPIGGGEWQPVMETEIPAYLKAMSVKAADDIEFIDLPYDLPKADVSINTDPKKEKPAPEPNWTKQLDVMVRKFEPFGMAQGSVADISTDGIEQLSGNKLRIVRGAVTGGYRWAVIFNDNRLAFGFSDVSPVAVRNLNSDLIIAARDKSGLQEYRVGSANKKAR